MSVILFKKNNSLNPNFKILEKKVRNMISQEIPLISQIIPTMLMKWIFQR